MCKLIFISLYSGRLDEMAYGHKWVGENTINKDTENDSEEEEEGHEKGPGSQGGSGRPGGSGGPGKQNSDKDPAQSFSQQSSKTTQ